MEAIRLSELTDLIKETIDTSFTEYYMVIAEISQINVNYSGHAYLQLVEKQQKGEGVLANLRAVIWANKYNLISTYFESVTGKSLEAGMKILIKTEISFHQVYGLSLVIHDIDPTYTLGDIEKQRQKIIDQLIDDGIFEMNKNLFFPAVPQNIAIISSTTAAGYDDFVNHLESNEFDYKFNYKLFNAVMQGEKTEKSIIAALDKIFKEYQNFDIVVIIRGGGSKLDLSAFDSYEIAANIAQFPLPIIAGIGHQRDLSIADLVAFKSMKTPTATADFIIQKTSEFETKLIYSFDSIKNLIRILISEELQNLKIQKTEFNNFILKTLHSADTRLKILNQQVISKTYMLISKNKQLLDFKKEKCKNSIFNTLNKHKEKLLNSEQKIEQKTLTYFLQKNNELKILETKLNAHNPQHILKLGFSITYKDGKIIKSAHELKKGDKLKTRLNDGNIDSEII